MAYIKCIEYYLPEKVISNKDLLKDFPEWDSDKVAQKVGILERHVSSSQETAGDLAYKAALRLLENNNIDPKTIDFILFCTQSPDYCLPSTSCILQDKLGLPTTAGAFDYNLGCSGCIYGMAVAKGLIASGIAKNILLLTGETYTKYLHPSDKSNRAIFGDGAAACLISTEGFAEIANFVLGTDGSGYDKLIIKTGGARQKESTCLSIIDDEGHVWYDDYLYMNGGAILNFTLEEVPKLIESIIKKNNLQKENIDYFLFHQANKYILNTIRKILGIPSNKFYINLTNTGNTVSSTILIGLKHCIDSGIIKQGDKVIIAGFGVGLSWGGTLLKF